MAVLEELMKVCVQIDIAKGELQAAVDSLKEASEKLKDLIKELMGKE